MTGSDIQDFYRDQTVFLTGATGSIGKLILEKLLRTCPDLSRIYLLIRPKKGKSEQERCNDLFDYACFDLLKSLDKDRTFKTKVTTIPGDCELPNLGIPDSHRRLLVEHTTIVIHNAANVKFDQSLRRAANSNVRAVRDVLALAKEMKRLTTFLHVSTAYSHCPRRDEISERFYEPPIEAEKLFALLDAVDDDRILEDLTPRILKEWPNTYVYSKAVAEDVVRRVGETGFKIAIIRPSILISTYEEPMPGWMDNLYGIGGVVSGIALGVVRCLNARDDYHLHLIPSDYLVSSILATGWDIQDTVTDNTIKIYNYVGSLTNLQTFVQLKDHLQSGRWSLPSTKMIWYPTNTIIASTFWYKVYIFWFHNVLPYIADFALVTTGNPPLAVKNYQKLNRLLSMLSYFILNEFHFDNTNVETMWARMSQVDRRLFKFNMDDLDWRRSVTDGLKGGRLYLLKDPPETLEMGRRKMFIFGVLHYFFNALFYYLMYRLLVAIFNCIIV